MQYTVQRGDTIAQVTTMLGTDWQTLKQQNPSAVGRSNSNGNWFLREGATVKTSDSFGAALDTAIMKNAGVGNSQVESETRPTKSNEVIYTVKPGDTVWDLAVNRYHVDPEDVLKVNGIDDPTKLQPGQQLRIILPGKGGPEEVVASWYGEFHHGLPMANGEPYNMFADTIAHKDIPLGTRVALENPETGETAEAIVTDRGPYVNGRDVDLSYGLAEKLSLAHKGVGSLIMQVL